MLKGRISSLGGRSHPLTSGFIRMALVPVDLLVMYSVLLCGSSRDYTRLA